MQQRQRRQLIRRIEQTVQFAECPAAHRHHLAGHQLFAAIAGPLPNPEADRQIGGVAQVIAVVGVNHIDVDIRIFAQKAAQPRNEPAHAEQRDQADGDLPRRGLLANVFGRLAQHVKRRADRAVIFPPLAAQHQMAPLPFGQRHLQECLQRFQLMADRRRRNHQLLRRRADAAQARDGLERPHGAQRRIVRQHR